MTPDALCLVLAATQFGVIGRAQALERGMSQKMIKTRVACGRWIRLFPGVYAIAGVPPTHRGWLLAAQLWLGERAVVSHRAAAVIWGLDGIHGEFVELTIVGARPQPPQGVVALRSGASTV